MFVAIFIFIIVISLQFGRINLRNFRADNNTFLSLTVKFIVIIKLFMKTFSQCRIQDTSVIIIKIAQ